MHAITLGSFIACTALVAVLTRLLTRGRDDQQSAAGYFLAGRSLNATTIAGSLLLTNLSTEQMVGLNGAAFADGLCVMAWEVLAVIALVLMALFFLPRFLKSGIATVPLLLELRYDRGTQVIANLIFLVAYAVILLPIILYTGATGLGGMLDLAGLTGIASETTRLWLTVWFVGLIGSVYAIFGGLRTVAVSDTLNGVGLLVGGLLITFFGLQAMGGEGGGVTAGIAALAAGDPARFNSIGGPGQSVPFSTLFTGVLLLNLFYWCTNQQIIQRTFGASSLAEGQKGVLLTGALKLLGPLYLVLPGIMAFQLYGAEGLRPDQAYGKLVHDVLPPPLTGFFAAVMVGAILSSFNSALNSTTTLFSLGFYGKLLRKDASEAQLVRAGKRFGAAVALVAMSVAPLLHGQASIFKYLQKMNGIYFIPIFSVVLVGLLTRRVPPLAAKLSLVVGFAVIAVGYFVPPFSGWVEAMHEFHFLGAVFVALVAMMLAVGRARPLAEPWQQVYTGEVDLAPWRPGRAAGVVLLVVVVAIYLAFADPSVLGKG